MEVLSCPTIKTRLICIPYTKKSTRSDDDELRNIR
jgi:hypothetical protein